MEEYVTFNKTNFTYKDITMTYEQLNKEVGYKRDYNIFLEKQSELNIPAHVIDKILLYYDNVTELTFGELTENLGYVKVYWNDKLVYDDEEGDRTFEEYENFKKHYDNKFVYEMSIKIVQWHHCILKVRGEEDNLDIIKE